MANYTFAELLTYFFYLHQDLDIRKTQEELAQQLGVGRRTITNWFSGNYVPRTPEVIEGIAKALSLTALQTDLLLYAVNPTWVKYGTPANILESAEIVRYREVESSKSQQVIETTPSPMQIEGEWRLTFQDKFAGNHQRWGTGVKENGICRIERKIQQGGYELTLHNLYHEDVFMGGDSNCFAPNIYYLSVQAKMLQGYTEDDGYGSMFEEINDECYGLMRLREIARQVSVVQTFNGGDKAQIYLRRKPTPSLRPQQSNKLAVLAVGDEHWFYVNDALISHHSIPRLSRSRLDVGIIAGSRQVVICRFENFRVYEPSG